VSLLTVINGWALFVNGNKHGPGVRIYGKVTTSYKSEPKAERQFVHELASFFKSHVLHVE